MKQRFTHFRALSLVILLLLALPMRAEVELVKPSLGTSTKIAPLYFGPNALPIPDMLDGSVSQELEVSLAADYYAGTRGDQTANIFTKIVVPLFSDRVNLSLWMTVVEYYSLTDESREAFRLSEDADMSGYEVGDAYVSTDIQLLRQRAGYRPDLTLRACIKTASSNRFYTARYFDAPGYFFDVSVAKSLYFDHPFWQELRGVATTGFLCWQTDNGRQNDATMYGVEAQLSSKLFTLTQAWGGYAGWEQDGDQPMSIKTNLSFECGAFSPFVAYQYGLYDYPYHQFRLGITYRCDVAF